MSPNRRLGSERSISGHALNQRLEQAGHAGLHSRSRRLRLAMWLLLLTLLCCLQDVAGETLCDYCSQIGRACNTTLGQCIACTPTLGCTERQVCDTKTGTCAVKGLFQPFLWSDGVLIILVFLATGLSNAGGIGGGILLVPLLSLFAGFTLKNASANAQPLIFAASIANAIVNIPRRHVARDTPRIDWNLVACTVPFFLMGTTPGTFMNQAFPSYFTAFVLSALLAVLSVQSGIFGLRLLRERLRKRSKGSGSEQNASLSSVSAANGHSVELSPIASGSREGHSSVSKEDTMASTGAGQVEKADTTFANPKVPAEKLPISSTLPAANASNVSTMSSSPLLTAAPGEGVSLEDGINEPPNIGERVEQRPVMTAGQACSENQSREWLCRLDPLLCAQNHEELLAAERPWFQWRTMIFLLSCWVILFIIQLFSGSAHKSSPLGIPLCGAIYWILFGIQESALFLLGCLTIWRNLRLNILRDRLGYPWYRKNGLGDIRWTRNLIFGYPIWAFIAGIFGSWVGIGGSSLLIPFLNLVGHADPATTQSSMSISNLLGSASAAFVYLAQGRLNISYALFYGLFALLGSYTGVWMVYFLVERYQIRALFVFALTICFSVALGAMLYIAIRNTLGVEAAGVGWIFTNICAFVG